MTAYETLSSAVDAVNDLQFFVENCRRGMTAGETAVEYIELVREAKRVLHQLDPFPSTEIYERAKADALKIQNFAAAEVSSGFSYLHGLAAIRGGSILEVAVDDLAVLVLRDRESWAKSQIIGKLKGPLVEFAAASVEAQAEFLAEELKSNTQAALKPGVGRFETLLNPIGLGGPVHDEVRKVLLELAEVRNLVAHRGGMIDRYFAEHCPWFGQTVGERLLISARQLGIYMQAARAVPALGPIRLAECY